MRQKETRYEKDIRQKAKLLAVLIGILVTLHIIKVADEILNQIF